MLCFVASLSLFYTFPPLFIHAYFVFCNCNFNIQVLRVPSLLFLVSRLSWLTSLHVWWACIVSSGLVDFNQLEFWGPKSRMLSLGRICFILWCAPDGPVRRPRETWDSEVELSGLVVSSSIVDFATSPSALQVLLHVLWISVAKRTRI